MADDLTLTETVEFFADRTAEEADSLRDEIDGDIPPHGEVLLVDDAVGVMKAVESAALTEAVGEEVDDEEVAADIEDAVVEVVASIGTLAYEYDLDIVSAVEDRMEFAESMDELEAAIEDADSEGEQMEALDEHLDDEMADAMGVQMGPSVGESVDADDYDHDETNRSFH